jgi:uncharacterized membrane protein YbhN (UPF0104 family)
VRRRWRLLAGILVLVVGARYLLRFPWSVTWTALASADRRLLAAAAAANLLSLACKARAWQLLLRPLAPVRARAAQAATFVGAAVGSVAVAMSGEAARVQFLTLDGVPAGAAARAIAASRVVEAGALGLFVACFAGVVTAPDAVGVLHGWRLGLAAAGLVLAAVAVLRRLPWLRSRFNSTSASGYELRKLAAPLALATLAWALQWATYHWSIAAAHAHAPPAASALALVVSNLGGLFRLTPGNVGVVQGAVVLGLAPAGVPVTRALAGGLALQAVEVVPVILIGAVILACRGLGLTQSAAEPDRARATSPSTPIASQSCVSER